MTKKLMTIQNKNNTLLIHKNNFHETNTKLLLEPLPEALRAIQIINTRIFVIFSCQFVGVFVISTVEITKTPIN